MKIKISLNIFRRFKKKNVKENIDVEKYIEELNNKIKELSSHRRKYVGKIKKVIIVNAFFIARIIKNAYNNNRDLIISRNSVETFTRMYNIAKNIALSAKYPEKVKLQEQEWLGELERDAFLMKKNMLLDEKDYNNILKHINNIVSFRESGKFKKFRKISEEIRYIENFIEKNRQYLLNSNKFKELENNFNKIKNEILTYVNLYSFVVRNLEIRKQ